MKANEDDYLLCRSILEEGSKTFFFASKNLPEDKKKAFWAVYAFCRKTDDIIDEGDAPMEVRRKNLANWKRTLIRAHGGKGSNNGVIRAFVETMEKNNIPQSLPLRLIQGVAMDSKKVSFSSYGNLRNYCFSVASVVGLMLLHVMDSNMAKARRHAIALGIAMQLTNILRDVGEDARAGRFYLPKKELAEFGLSHSDLLGQLEGKKLREFRQFLKFQIRRAREYYRRALEGIGYLPQELKFAITMAARLYQKILDKIEQNSYDVITKRAYVPLHEKLLLYISFSLETFFPMRQLSRLSGLSRIQGSPAVSLEFLGR